MVGGILRASLVRAYLRKWLAQCEIVDGDYVRRVHCERVLQLLLVVGCPATNRARGPAGEHLEDGPWCRGRHSRCRRG